MHEYKDLAEKLETLSTEQQVLQAQVSRLDEQGRRQDQQASSLVDHSVKLQNCATDLAKVKESVQRLAQHVKKCLASGAEKSSDHIQTSVNERPMVMVSMKQWEDINNRVRMLDEFINALGETNEDPEPGSRDLMYYRSILRASIDRVKSLKAQRDEASTLSLRALEAESWAKSDVISLQKGNNALSGAVDRLQTENNTLMNEVKESETREKKLCSKVSQNHETLNEMEEDKRSLLSENARLQKLMQDAQAESHFSLGKAKALQDTVANYEGQLKALTREVMILREESAEAEEDA